MGLERRAIRRRRDRVSYERSRGIARHALRAGALHDFGARHGLEQQWFVVAGTDLDGVHGG
jgi:hypothetical protein